MAGLLESLESLFNGSGVSGQVSGQATGLGSITSAVQALKDGPQALGNIGGALTALPAPAGLQGIGNFSTSLSSLSFPTDFSSALAPILGPLAGINVQASVGAAAQFTAAFDLIKEIVRLATGKALGGPSGMPPDSPGFQMPETPSADEMRAMIAAGNAFLTSAGAHFDAAEILKLLQKASLGYNKPRFWLPVIPFLDDFMEALATITIWQTMDGDQLSGSIAGTINRVAQLMAMPRERVARPIIEAAGIIGASSNELAVLNPQVAAAMASLRNKIKSGGGQPSFLEVTAVEKMAITLDRLAASTDATSSPLSRYSLADEDLTRSLLAVIRALEPAYDLSSLARTLQGGIAAIPAAPTALFDEAVTAIHDFDLSALIGPLKEITDKVRDVVNEVEQAKETVRQAIESALSPVADALDQALNAVGFNDIRSALEALPAQMQQFLNDNLTPQLAGVQSGVHDAVQAVSDAADSFDPQALIAPLRQAVQQAADVLNNDTVKKTFADLEKALDTAIQAIESIDLSVGADQSIDLIGKIEVKMSDIDPSSIPDASKPLLKQAVKVVTDIDFTAKVGAPVLASLEQAVALGPMAVLAAIEEGIDKLRTQLENFKPSVVIGGELDKPFRQLTDSLRTFKPSSLLDRLQDQLNQLAARLNVLDVGAVLNPLVELHTAIKTQVEALRPSNLMKPVEEAIGKAIDGLYKATGIDALFAGIHEVMDLVGTWTGLLAEARDLLTRAAAVLSEPGDASASVQQLVDDALAKLDSVDMGRLQSAFAAAAAAAAAIDREAITRDVANAFQLAGRQGPTVLASPDLAAIVHSVREFPLVELRGLRETPSRLRLIAAIESARKSADRLDAAQPQWKELGQGLTEASGVFQEKMLDYFRVSRIETASVFADFLNPPQTTAELREAVRAALEDGLKDPLTTVLLGFQALSPYARVGAEGMSSLIGAIHDKVDSLVGTGGLGGTLDAIEEAANLLRGINLQPIVQPLDAIFGRIEGAVDALSPEPLRQALQEARDAITNLFNVKTFLNQADIDALDQAYAAVVDKIAALSPSAIISATLDPEYQEVLAEFLPVLDLPKKLRASIEAAGRTLQDDALRELGRVEAAFDKMLKAIPLDGAGASGSVSVSVSGGIG